MTEQLTWYFLAAVAIAGGITLLLRALPFAILKPLRESKFVSALGTWMPVGILAILALVTLYNQVVSAPEKWWIAAVALAVTVTVHLCTGRKTVWSVAAGTAVYVTLLAVFGG